jgi:nucleotide-binding universal stress UspA family protein
MKILLATDGSEYSKGAAEFLTCLKLTPQDEITIFHAVYWIPFLYDAASYIETFKEIKQDLAPKIIDSIMDVLKPVQARISTAIVEGSPAQCIIDAVKTSDINMVVMGARGIKGIESLFAGSVTRAVAIKSPKPVLVTKLPLRQQPVFKVLYATDGSEYSRDTGNFLTSMPFPDNTEITILNVVPPEFLDIPETFAPKVNERIIEIRDQAQSIRLNNSQRIVEQAEEILSKTIRTIRLMSEVGDASTVILRVSEEIKADLIVVGCRGLRGIKGMMGSVSRNILAHSKCSVLIGKTCEE